MPQFDDDAMTGDEVIEGEAHDGAVTATAAADWDEKTRKLLSFDYWTEQPTASHSRKVKEHEEYDNTSLDPSAYAKKIHRDYLAHVMRWGWISRQIKRYALTNERTNVLEVGCGRELSLFNALRSSVASKMPDRMTMVDINRTKVSKVKWSDIRGEFDFVTRWHELRSEGLTYDIAVNTEVIEHVATPLGMAMLEGIYELLEPGGHFFISTPVYNGHRAVNHIREYTVPELDEMLTISGFEIERRYGTFASWNDIKRGVREDERLTDAEKTLILDRYEDTAEFYGHDVMACYAAPLYPDYSRNNVWHCRKPE